VNLTHEVSEGAGISSKNSNKLIMEPEAASEGGLEGPGNTGHKNKKKSSKKHRNKSIYGNSDRNSLVQQHNLFTTNNSEQSSLRDGGSLA